PTPCSPAGACCKGSSCERWVQSACDGTYQGDGSVCSPSPCAGATGICCSSSNACTLIHNSTEGTSCQSAGGHFSTLVTSCSGTPCPPGILGTCCNASTCSLIYNGVESAQCTTGGGNL